MIYRLEPRLRPFFMGVGWVILVAALSLTDTGPPSCGGWDQLQREKLLLRIAICVNCHLSHM